MLWDFLKLFSIFKGLNINNLGEKLGKFLISWIMKSISYFAQAVKFLVPKIGAFLAKVLPILWTALKQFAATIWDKLKTTMANVLPIIGAWLKGAMQYVGALISAGIKSFINSIGKTIEGWLSKVNINIDLTPFSDAETSMPEFSSYVNAYAQ